MLERIKLIQPVQKIPIEGRMELKYDSAYTKHKAKHTNFFKKKFSLLNTIIFIISLSIMIMNLIMLNSREGKPQELSTI